MFQPPAKRRSLTVLLSSIVVVSVMLVFGVRGAHNYFHERTRIVDGMRADAAESIARLTRNIAPLIQSYAVNEYTKLVASEIRLKRHYAIVVRDLKMGRIIGRQAYVSGKIHAENGGVEDFDENDAGHLHGIKRAYFSESVPILSDTGERLGSISVYLTNEALKRQSERILHDVLFTTTVTGLILITVLVYSVRRLFMRPLRRIAQVIQRRDADGIPTSYLPDFGYREFAVLTDTANTMLDVIRQSRDSLQRQSTRLQNVIEGTNIGTWEWNVQTGETEFDDRWAEIVGYTLAELSPVSLDTWKKLVHPDDLPMAEELLKRHFAGELELYECELRMRHKDGHWVWVQDRGKLTSRTAEGAPLRMFGTHRDITERKLQAMLLVESEARFRSFFENNSSVMLLITPDKGEIVAANQSAEAFYGYTNEELVGMAIDRINTLSPQQVAAERKRVQEEGRAHLQFRHRLANGEIRDVEVYSSPIHVGEQELLFSIVHDITDRVHAEEQLRLAAGVFTQAREGIMITDSEGHVVDVNDAFTSITGYSREEVLGKNPSMLTSGHYDRQFYSAMWRDLAEKDHWYGEIWNRRKNGELFASLLTISALRDADGNTRHYVALFSDITVLKENERELEHIAHHDALTGLPNRLLLGDRLRQAMVQESRRGQLVAVAFLDLDGFKEVNDQYGHESGDELLITVAKRIKNVLREGDTLARIGGDEFVAVLPDLGAHEDCNPILSRMLAAAAEKVVIRGQSVRVTASLGVTFYPQSEEVDADQLLRQADQAMYQAKLAGKNRYHVFDTEQDRSLRGRREELKRIGQALAHKEFELYYQPKVNMRSGAVIGLEALVRWRHPEQGLVLPGAFLPVIEDHPMIVTLGEWTLASAMAQLSEWKRGGLHMRVSVNIAALHLQQRDFVGHLRELLAAHPDVSSDQIELEVLETSALENVSYVSKLIEDCRQLGVSFALDDFGTGYSSLTYLKRLPAQVLKIDRSFVRDMHDDPEDLAILEGVIGLAEAFRRQVIAEGVETVEHGELLLSLGCELAQGYAIGYPMPAEALPAWLANWRPPPSWIDRSVVRREQLPILYAIVEHRAWITGLEEYLEDRRSEPPTLEPQQCRFGRWLEENTQPGDDVYARLVPIHEQVHALAAEILARKEAGDSELVKARIGELHALRDQLLDTLYARIDCTGSPARAAVNS